MGRIIQIFLAATFPIMTFAQQIYMTKSGTVNFISNAPLELIKASSGELQGALNPDEKTFAFVIDNKSFKGFNSPLQQEHFYENYMHVQEFPTSTFEGRIIEDIDTRSAEEQIIRAKGILNIHGIEQERIIKGTIKFSGNKLLIRASFTVPLEEHNIKIPKVVYQKIAENIEVNIEAELARKNP